MDTVSSSRALNCTASFADGDTRLLSFDEPGGSINLKAAAEDLADFIAEKQILIGDRQGAAFTGFSSAKLVTKTATKLDIS